VTVLRKPFQIVRQDMGQVELSVRRSYQLDILDIIEDLSSLQHVSESI